MILAVSFSGQKADSAPDAGAPLRHESPEVQPLPEFSEPGLSEASPAELAELDGSIDALLAPELSARSEALARVGSVEAGWLPALVQRFESLASGANKSALKTTLDAVRQRARAPADERARRSTPGAMSLPRQESRKPLAPPPQAPAVDLLALVVADTDRSSPSLRPATEVLAYSRMFEAIGTLPAVRRLVATYVRFGEPFRVDTELALERLGDRATAALIETRGHPLPRVAEWARQRLGAMGKSLPSEALEVQDPTLRADILRAYGETHDVETAPLLIAFAASERARVRLAARQAVALLGEAGLWPLRDAYERTLGERAPGDWSWRRVAEELFAQFDRQRLSEPYRLFNRGREAEQRGDLAAARQLFDQVLAWDPQFERGAAMAPVYVAFAEQQADAHPEAATLALRRAERLTPSGPARDRALSLRYTLDARTLRARGIVDEVLVERARELDPENARAARLEAELREESEGDGATFQRYVGAAVILISTLLGLGVMALRLRRNRTSSEAAAR